MLCAVMRRTARRGSDLRGGALRCIAEHSAATQGFINKRRNNMQEISVSIRGRTPLLCNRFTDEAAMKATTGQTSALKGSQGDPTSQAERKLYTGLDDEPMIPQPNLFRCIIDAGKFFKSGKSKVTTQKSSLIPACIELTAPDGGIELKIKHEQPWSVDTRPVRIPATGGRILCHRPCFFDWELDFVLFIDEEFITKELTRDILDAAGRRIGLGDFRPDCKGCFGKFEVIHWEEIEEKPKKKAATKRKTTRSKKKAAKKK